MYVQSNKCNLIIRTVLKNSLKPATVNFEANLNRHPTTFHVKNKLNTNAQERVTVFQKFIRGCQDGIIGTLEKFFRW